MKTNEEYLLDSVKCPVCDTTMVDWGIDEDGLRPKAQAHDGDEIWQTNTCKACGALWVETYSLIGYELLEKGVNNES